MGKQDPIANDELEEAPQDPDHLNAPGDGLQIEVSRGQTAAAGLPPDNSRDWPSPGTQQRIVDRRQGLYDAMQSLEASVARPSGQDDWATGVEEALTQLGSVLQRHIDEIEAPDGLFEEVIQRAPHLVSHVETLRSEHQSLIAGCEAALDMVTDEVDVKAMRRKVLGVLGRLSMHRHRGAELLFDLYDVDFGAAG